MIWLLQRAVGVNLNYFKFNFQFLSHFSCFKFLSISNFFRYLLENTCRFEFWIFLVFSQCFQCELYIIFNAHQKSFHPSMTHQVFGMKENIFGYSNLNINLFYTAGKLTQYYHKTADETISRDDGGVEPDDIEEKVCLNLIEFWLIKSVIMFSSISMKFYNRKTAQQIVTTSRTWFDKIENFGPMVQSSPSIDEMIEYLRCTKQTWTIQGFLRLVLFPFLKTGSPGPKDFATIFLFLFI